jgi:MFS family permease
MLVGSLGPAAWWARLQGRFGARVGGSATIGLALALAGSTSDRHVLVASFAIVGLGAATTTLVGKTHRMLARPLAYRARMSAAAIMTIQISQALGPALAGIALTHWSVRTVYVVFGLLSAASALGFFLVPGFRAFMALEHDEVDDFYARAFPRAFERV